MALHSLWCSPMLEGEVGKWFANGGASLAWQAGLLKCLTHHLAPSTLFISGIHMLQVQSNKRGR